MQSGIKRKLLDTDTTLDTNESELDIISKRIKQSIDNNIKNSNNNNNKNNNDQDESKLGTELDTISKGIKQSIDNNININNSSSNNNDINNNNNNNNDQDEFTKRFFKVWRHKVTRNVITDEIKKFSINKKIRNTKHTIQTLKEFKHRRYLIKLVLVSNLNVNDNYNDEDNENGNEDNIGSGGAIDLPIDLIPSLVEVIIFRINVDIKADDLPNGIKYIEFRRAVKNVNIQFIPKSIQKINFFKCTKAIIPVAESFDPFYSLRSLGIDRESQHLLQYANDKLPNLETLIINGYKHYDSLQVPPTVSTLVFGCRFNQDLPTIPSTVLNLQIGRIFNKQIHFSQLNQLQSLKIDTRKVPLTLDDMKVLSNLKKLSFYSIKYTDTTEKDKFFPNIESCTVHYNYSYISNHIDSPYKRKNKTLKKKSKAEKKILKKNKQRSYFSMF